MTTGAPRVAAPMASHTHSVERPAHVVSGAHAVERPAHLVSGAHPVERSAPAHLARQARPVERPAYVGRGQQMGDHIVEEYSSEGPIVVGPHDATSLTGDRLSYISGIPGRDAHIPYGPRSTYVPSYSDLGTFEIGSVNPAT
jgi:hypothetical protein